MFRVLCIILSLVFCAPVQATAAFAIDYDERITKEGRTYIDCSLLQEERLICERLETARMLVSLTPLKTFVQRVGKRDALYREFVLAAYDPVELRFHDILLGMPVRVGKDFHFQPILRTDGEYQVKRLRGQSLNKMVFSVLYGGRELQVYSAKHLLFTKEKFSSLWSGRTVETIREVTYMATAPHLVHLELARHGQMLFMTAIDKAVTELRTLRVMSLAHPGELVGDRVPSLAIANLLVAEQTDPCFLQDRPKGCDRLIPTRPYRSDDEVRQAVNVEFAVNGLRAFRYMRSSADARGALQFTNNKTKKSEGTYAAMVKIYPQALLDPDFRRGSESLINLAKAAALLIDYELSNKKLPQWVREAALQDPEFAAMIAGGAYNGGPSQSKLLAQIVEGFKREYKLELDDLTVSQFPMEPFKRWLDDPKIGLKPETLLYIKKIMDNWWHLRRHGHRVDRERLSGELI